MARPTLWNHRKFRELTMALKSEALAIGTLECLWRGPYDSGDPLIGTSEAVEHAAYWKGKRGSLSELLVRIGFLDITPRGYEIHDLMDHAPDYVKKRHAREEKRRQRPVSDRTTSGQRPVSDQHSRSVLCALSTEPLPAHGGHTASGVGSQATDFEQPNSEQPNEPMPPEAAEFFAGLASIGKPPSARTPIDEGSRRDELRRQAALICGGGDR